MGEVGVTWRGHIRCTLCVRAPGCRPSCVALTARVQAVWGRRRGSAGAPTSEEDPEKPSPRPWPTPHCSPPTPPTLPGLSSVAAWTLTSAWRCQGWLAGQGPGQQTESGGFRTKVQGLLSHHCPLQPSGGPQEEWGSWGLTPQPGCCLQACQSWPPGLPTASSPGPSSRLIHHARQPACTSAPPCSLSSSPPDSVPKVRVSAGGAEHEREVKPKGGCLCSRMGPAGAFSRDSKLG